MTRTEISDFLRNQAGKSKEEVLANFVSWVSVQGVNTEKIAKLIADIKSYPEWSWGE